MRKKSNNERPCPCPRRHLLDAVRANDSHPRCVDMDMLEKHVERKTQMIIYKTSDEIVNISTHYKMFENVMDNRDNIILTPYRYDSFDYMVTDSREKLVSFCLLVVSKDEELDDSVVQKIIDQMDISDMIKECCELDENIEDRDPVSLCNAMIIKNSKKVSLKIYNHVIKGNKVQAIVFESGLYNIEKSNSGILIRIN